MVGTMSDVSASYAGSRYVLLTVARATLTVAHPLDAGRR
jgi:hypothetical protein